jgi:GTPase SAR1 family protein
VIVVGEVNSGKSAVVRRYVHNFFGDRGDYRATLGVDFNLKLIHYNDELEIRLQLWDIAGQAISFINFIKIIHIPETIIPNLGMYMGMYILIQRIIFLINFFK